MEQYLSKSVLVEKLKRKIKEIDKIGTYLSPKGILTNLLCHLDTLEVKEVDLDEEIEKCLKQYHMIAVGKKEFEPIAKHFFELGINARKENNN